MSPDEPSLPILLARYFSPFALPHEKPVRHVGFKERRRLRRARLLALRPLLRDYIFRSGMLVAGSFVASLILTLLPFPHLAIIGISVWLISILHTVVLIFMEQSANNLENRRKR